MDCGKIASPNGKISLSLTTKDGALFYEVSKDGYAVFGASKLWLKTDKVDFSSGLEFVSASYEEIDEKYSVISRKAKEYSNKAQQVCATFKKDGATLCILARAYDDGVAFRYRLSGDYGSAVCEECSQFAFIGGKELWYMPYHHCYEGAFENKSMLCLSANNVSIPALFKTDKDYVLVSEAALDGSYSGSMLKTIADGVLQTCFVATQTRAVSVAKDGCYTPWRFAVIGTLANVVENTLSENLALPEFDGVDYSFVKPGVASWTWLVGARKMQKDGKSVKKYIDLAAEMGWQYFIMDDGWQPPVILPWLHKKYGAYYGLRSWAQEMVTYANSKGVGLFAWVKCDDLNTPFKRQRLTEWAKLGIKGIKVDFFDCENQERMCLYDEIYKECARLGLMVNAHGANKPTGEVRTFPNVLTREGIRGEEYGLIDAYQYTVIPFTRTAVGPADVTETLVSAKGKTGEGFQIAVSFVIHSGLHCLASKDTEYYESPARPLYKNMPTVWDDTRYVCGAPGEYVGILRRSGEVFYLAGITTAARKFELKYDFLGDGKYEAALYADNENRKLRASSTIVTKADALALDVAEDDGFVVKFTPVK